MKIAVNNIEGRIMDVLTLDQLSVISSICSFQVEGGEYKQAEFKRRSHGKSTWDGYRRLFNAQTQKFPIGLLPRIMNLMNTVGIPVEIIDHRVHMDRTLELSCNPRDRREYQYEVLMSAILNGNGIIKSATGSGKTTMASLIMATLGKPSVFIVHTKDLLYQAKESFEKLMQIPIGQIGDGIVDIRDITVATVQTLALVAKFEYESYKYDEDTELVDNSEVDIKKYDEIRKWSSKVGVVMFDEVQRVASRTAYGARFMFENADHAYGLSASPWRDDGAELMIEGAFGPIICDISASRLIDEGYLVQPEITIKRVNNNIWNGKDYTQIYKSAVVENAMRNMQVCSDAIEQYKLGRSTLVLITQIKHGEVLEMMMKSAGYPAIFISGKSKSKVRRQVIDDMRSGKCPLVIASTIADVGLDVPRITSIIDAGAGKSSVTALQRVGRAIRPFNGKDRAVYITYRDNAPFLNQQIDRKIQIWKTEPRFIIKEA